MYIPVEHEHIPLVVIDNFLPRDYVTKLYEDFIKLKPHFGVPHWSGGYNDGAAYNPDEPLSPLCTGQDVWLPFNNDQAEKNKDLGYYVSNLSKYIFHQGILDFLTHAKNEELTAYAKYRYLYKYHIINYGDGGYYNWHRDLSVSGMTWDGLEVNKQNAFTFALTLVKDPSVMKGGEQYFMYKNHTYRLPLTSNQLAIFPSTVFHACSEITAPKDLAWENKRFNIQAWLCHG
jgi:hypothetical protein